MRKSPDKTQQQEVKKSPGNRTRAKVTETLNPKEDKEEICGEKLLGKMIEYMKKIQPRSYYHFERPVKNLFQDIKRINNHEVTLIDLYDYFTSGEGQAFWEKGKEPKFVLPIKGYLYKEGLIHKEDISDYGLAYNKINN